MKGNEYREFLLTKIADAVADAWNSRSSAAVGFAKASSGFGWNRISTYEDGHAVCMVTLKVIMGRFSGVWRIQMIKL